MVGAPIRLAQTAECHVGGALLKLLAPTALEEELLGRGATGKNIVRDAAARFGGGRQTAIHFFEVPGGEKVVIADGAGVIADHELVCWGVEPADGIAVVAKCREEGLRGGAEAGEIGLRAFDDQKRQEPALDAFRRAR